MTSVLLPGDFEAAVCEIEAQVRKDLELRNRWSESFEPVARSYATAVVTARVMENELPSHPPDSPEFHRLARRIERTRSQIVKLQAALGLSAAAREREGKQKATRMTLAEIKAALAE